METGSAADSAKGTRRTRRTAVRARAKGMTCERRRSGVCRWPRHREGRLGASACWWEGSSELRREITNRQHPYCACVVSVKWFSGWVYDFHLPLYNLATVSCRRRQCQGLGQGSGACSDQPQDPGSGTSPPPQHRDARIGLNMAYASDQFRHRADESDSLKTIEIKMRRLACRMPVASRGVMAITPWKYYASHGHKHL